MPIRLLPPQVANKIAAGEVVERPASVVKELIENAIDAGATDIRIEMQQGGRRLLRVTDNGSGIVPQEVELAFSRHATSKITSEDDLFRITTLGFRGEALASIAAVAQVSMFTRVEAEETGVFLRIRGGEQVQRERRGGPVGTQISVENLFFNTPARLKFLRADSTETGHIAQLVNSYALAYPELRFSLIDDGRLILQTFGTGKVSDVLVKVFGLETSQRLLEVQPESVPEGDGERGNGTLLVYGYVGAPELHRAQRNHTFFVNKRWIHDRSLSFAVEEAYRTLIPAGRYPLAVLYVTMDAADVDVNVHPTKREVRFRDPRRVFSAVQRAVRHAVIGQSPVATMTQRPTVVLGHERADTGRQAPWRPVTEPAVQTGQMALDVQRTADSVTGSIPMLEQLPMLRVLGQIKQEYIIAEGPDGLYLIDQHAAHERILFDQLKAEQAAMSVSSQALLEPLTVELLPQQKAHMDELAAYLSAFGFDVTVFGGNAYLIRAVPASLQSADLPSVVRELLDAQAESGMLSVDGALAVIACHGSVRAGQTLTTDEARELVRQLEQTSTPYTCPHGRPTMIHLSSYQLERSFGRR